jgi:hypothetical protein
MFRLLNDTKTFDGVEDVYAFGEYHHAVMKTVGEEENLKRHLQQLNHSLLEIRGQTPDIEDCFIALMKTRKDN